MDLSRRANFLFYDDFRTSLYILVTFLGASSVSARPFSIKLPLTVALVGSVNRAGTPSSPTTLSLGLPPYGEDIDGYFNQYPGAQATNISVGENALAEDPEANGMIMFEEAVMRLIITEDAVFGTARNP